MLWTNSNNRSQELVSLFRSLLFPRACAAENPLTGTLVSFGTENFDNVYKGKGHKIAENTSIGIRHADHVASSIREGWH
jgi:hypothetical protein